MPAPTIVGLTITFPANCKYIVPPGGLGSTVIDIAAGDVVLDACSTAAVVGQSINWKQGVASDPFVSLPALSWVGRTALSGASATVGGIGVPGGNVKTHVRGMIFTDLVVADALQLALVSYTYKRERYDLIEVDSGGILHIIKGTEDDFAASEFLPTATVGRYPLFYVYIWNDTAQVISGHSWLGTTPKDRAVSKKITALRAYNQSKLAHVLAKIASQSALVIGAYGDSITAVGGGWAATGGADDTTWLDDTPDNATGFKTRNASNFNYWHTAGLRAKYPELGSVWPQQTINLVTWGIPEQIKTALSALSGNTVTVRNWGIGGTSSGTGNTAAGAPNGGDAGRLAAFNGLTYDLVLYNFLMNDFVGFATQDLNTVLTANINSIKAANPNADIVLMGAPGINTENPNSLAWHLSAENRYMQVAKALGCAFVPTYMVSHGDSGYLQLSRDNYSGGNRYNHQTPYELAKYGAWAITALGF